MAFVKGPKVVQFAPKTADKPDFYQECLSIFSDLSEREIDFLYRLDKNELPYIDERAQNRTNSGEYNQNYSANKGWIDAREKCCKELDIDIHMFDALITKLLRTGFISTLSVMDDSSYYFSPLYRNFKKMISLDYYQV